MNKKEKIIWTVVGIVALILVVLILVRVVSSSNSEVEIDSYDQENNTEETKDHNNQVLEVPKGTIFPSDLVGTWLTAVAGNSNDDIEYQGFVLRPNGTVLSINNEMNFDAWRVEDYKLIFSKGGPASIEQVSYIIDYIGKDGLTLRAGDTTIHYNLEAK